MERKVPSIFGFNPMFCHFYKRDDVIDDFLNGKVVGALKDLIILYSIISILLNK